MSGNASEGALLDAKLTGADFWTGGVYGPEAGFVGIVGLIVMLALLIAYGFWTKKLR